MFALLSAVQASASVLFQQAHPGLTQITVGLCFLPLGVGCMVATVITGKQLNASYGKARATWEAEARQLRLDGQSEPKIPLDAPWTKEEELTFSIEKTRLTWAMWYGAIASLFAIGYGWVMHAKTNLAVPLIFLFFGEHNSTDICTLARLTLDLPPAGYVMVAQVNSVQTLMIDNFPAHGAATTAVVSTGCKLVPQDLISDL